MSAPDLPAIRELAERNIPHSLFVHTGPVHSLEQAASERDQRPEQVVRSLLFRLAEDDFALVLVAGPRQIPWKTLRTFFKQRRLTLASEEEVLRVTGYEIGTVSPFGLATPIPTYIDESVLANEELSLGSGRRGTAILMHSRDLLLALPTATRINLFS